MRIKNEKGFTIIELIVVIAIMAVLAAIVVTSVIIYVGRARDTAVKADLSQIAKKLQIYYADNNTLKNFDLAPITAIKHPCTRGNFVVNLPSSDGVNAYAVYAQLCTTAVSSAFWCIDSAGKNVQMSSMPTGTACVESGVYSCMPGCSYNQTCYSGNRCVDNYVDSCIGSCSGCETELTSNDCFQFSGCQWDEGSGDCFAPSTSCSGSSSTCGNFCPSGCGWGH